MDVTHLAVDLGKLRLTIGTQVLISEALHHLEVPVDTGNHQQLLVGLRGLWEGVELSRIHPRGDDEVSRPLRGRLDQKRRLHLHKLLPVEVATDQLRHPVAEGEIAYHTGAADVEVAVLHPQLIPAIRLLLDREGRGLGGGEDIERVDIDLNVTGRHLGVLRGALHDGTYGLDHILTTDLRCLLELLMATALSEDQLGDPIPITKVDKGHPAHLTYPLHPSGQRHLGANIGGAKLSTSLCSIHDISHYVRLTPYEQPHEDYFIL